jgi:hypothetical protein
MLQKIIKKKSLMAGRKNNVPCKKQVKENPKTEINNYDNSVIGTINGFHITESEPPAISCI